MDKSADTHRDGGLSEAEIFTLLSMQRRRELLRALDRADGVATVGDVTNELAAVEHGDDATARTRKAVYVSLHQTHIPRLVEADALVHDARGKTLRLTERGQLLLAYLRFDPTERRPGLLSRVFRPGGRKHAR